MTVFAPLLYDEVGVMLREALAITTGPVAIRWPKTEAARGAVAGIGVSGRRIRVGTDVCLLGVGKLVAACEEAADLLAAAGVDATVWDVRVAAPLDPVMLDDARRHSVVVTAEDGVVEGGVGALVASALAARSGSRRLGPGGPGGAGGLRAPRPSRRHPVPVGAGRSRPVRHRPRRTDQGQPARTGRTR